MTRPRRLRRAAPPPRNSKSSPGVDRTSAPPRRYPKPKPTAALRTVQTPALAEPHTTSQSRPGRYAPDPLRARAGALAVRCAFPSRLLPTLRVCWWLFVPAVRATRRRTARHKVSSVSSRGAVWCGTHAVGLRPPSSPAAPPPLRGCWHGVRVVSAVPCSGADFVVTVVTACLPPLRGRCGMLAICARGACWCRFASPSSLRFLPGRPRAASLSYPSGTHNTWQPHTNFQVTSSQLSVSIRVRGAVDESACLAALSPTCGRRWRGVRGGLRSVAVRVRKRRAFGKNAGRNRHEKARYCGTWIISGTEVREETT
jgi:hypothetical protein